MAPRNFDEKTFSNILAGLDDITQEKGLRADLHARKLLKEAKALADDNLGETEVYMSGMMRTRQTARLAAPDAAKQDAQSCDCMFEMRLGSEKSLLRVRLAEFLSKLKPLSQETLSWLMGGAPQDNLDNRGKLVDVNDGFNETTIKLGADRGSAVEPLPADAAHGEDTADYARRAIQGYTAVVLAMTGQGGIDEKGNKLKAEDIATILKDLPPPTKEQVKYLFDVVKHYQNPGNEKYPMPAYDESLVYKPLADALACLPDGTRIILARHANTIYSDAKLMAGGNVNLRLTKIGKRVARTVGARINALLGIDPADRTMLLFGHSNNLPLLEAAFLACRGQHVDMHIKPKFDPDKPHVMELVNGNINIRYLDDAFLKEKALAASGNNAGVSVEAGAKAEVQPQAQVQANVQTQERQHRRWFRAAP